MLDHRQRPPNSSLAPFTPPSPIEREALGRVAAFLQRAGNEVESRSLMAAFGAPSAGARDLHQSLRAAAALCAGIAEEADGPEAAPDAPAARHPSSHWEASG